MEVTVLYVQYLQMEGMFYESYLAVEVFFCKQQYVTVEGMLI